MLISLIGVAQIPNPKSNTYVNDSLGYLENYQVDRLNWRIRKIETKTSVQIAVVIVRTLPTNVSIEDFARGVGRKWHVGNARNGLVYVAAIDQRLMRLEVAQNLEGDIPDAVAKDLLETVKPFFRVKNYYVGLETLLDGIELRLDPVTKAQLALAAKAKAERREAVKELAINVMWILMGILVVGGLIYISLLPLIKKKKAELQAKREEERKEAIRLLKAEQKRKEEQDARAYQAYLKKLADQRKRDMEEQDRRLASKVKEKMDTSATKGIVITAATAAALIAAEELAAKKKRETEEEERRVQDKKRREEEDRKRRDDTSSSWTSYGSTNSDSSSSSSSDNGNWGGSGDSGFSGGGASDSW